ncbi:MAG: HAMP domain-containing sensor histidine kinase [Myxococcota bacterium]
MSQARGSIRRPLFAYAFAFSLLLSGALSTAASLGMIRAARRAQLLALSAEVHWFASADTLAEIRGRIETAGETFGVGLVTAQERALGIGLEEARIIAAGRAPGGSIEAIGVPRAGEEAYVVYAPDPGAVLASIRRELSRLLVLTIGLSFAFGAALAWMASRLVLGPLRDLERAAEDPRIADPIFQASDDAPDEVTALAQTFRRTVRRLDEERRHIQAQHQELEKMQDSLVRASKLASVGRLAAGVAHEVGNPLAAVVGYLNLLRRGLAPEEQADVLERSQRELNRIHETIRKLLAYARPDDGDEKPAPLATGQVIGETLVLLRAHPAVRSVQVVDLVEPKDLVDAVGASQPLGQILMNLVINAAQAAGGVPGAEVRIRRELTDKEVLLHVEDNGPGIPAALREQIFDPFFSTKPSSEGTGLGLAISRALAERMGGDLSLGDPAEGADLVLRLPRAVV